MGAASFRGRCSRDGNGGDGGGDGVPASMFLVFMLLGAVVGQAQTRRGGEGGGVGIGGGGRCGDAQLACVSMAAPLLTDANLIFPDNMADVNQLCTRWRDFVRCVKDYTGRCFSPAQQEEFVRAVQSPVGLAHRLCSEGRYQAEYLEYAFCIHSTITENGRCSKLYHQFVEKALEEVGEKPLCCSHVQFRRCVLEESARACGAAGKSTAVRHFAQDLLNKTFAYIQNKCATSEVSMQDCRPRNLEPSNRALNSSEASSADVSRGLGGRDGSVGGNPGVQQPRSQPAPALPHERDEEEQQPWQPGKALDGGAVAGTGSSVEAGGDAATGSGADALARSSPARGRGLPWPNAPLVPSPPSLVASVNAPPAPTANNPNANPPHTWYPWGKLNNVVDEPNQQGLAGKNMISKNVASIHVPYAFFFSVLAVALYYFS